MLETGPGSHTARLPRLVAKTLLFTLNPVGPHVQRQGGLFTDNHVTTRTTTTGMHVDYGWGSRKVLPVRGVTVVPGHAVAATFGAGARRSTATLKTLKAAIEAREVRHRARSLHINLNLFARVFSRRGPKLLKDVVSKVPWTGHSSSVGLCRPMAVITAVNKFGIGLCVHFSRCGGLRYLGTGDHEDYVQSLLAVPTTRKSLLCHEFLCGQHLCGTTSHGNVRETCWATLPGAYFDWKKSAKNRM